MYLYEVTYKQIKITFNFLTGSKILTIPTKTTACGNTGTKKIEIIILRFKHFLFNNQFSFTSIFIHNIFNVESKYQRSYELLVEYGRTCQNWAKLDDGSWDPYSFEKCAEMVKASKGKNGCHATNGIFMHVGKKDLWTCRCSKDDCTYRGWSNFLNIYKLPEGKVYFNYGMI